MEKVWVYVSDKPMTGEMLEKIKSAGNAFIQSWKAHDVPLTAAFEVVLERFIIVRVDEAQYGASGCSIDKLLRLIKHLETEHGIQLLNRLLVAYASEEGVNVVHSSKISELLANGKLNPETLVYDTSVSDSVQLAVWKKPLKDTWLKKYL